MNEAEEQIIREGWMGLLKAIAGPPGLIQIRAARASAYHRRKFQTPEGYAPADVDKLQMLHLP